MKHLCFAFSFILFLSSCQKNLASKDEVNTAIVASEANSPLKSHSLTFTSDYLVKPGEVPPFTFTKTLYSDARVKTIRMLSRKNPIYPGFKSEAEEIIGTFTYGSLPGNQLTPHAAYLKGTNETWEYYKLPSGAGARKSLGRKAINWRFKLDVKGFCRVIEDYNLPPTSYGPTIIFDSNPNATDNSYLIKDSYDSNGNVERKFGFFALDQYGNILRFQQRYSSDLVQNPGESSFVITYDYNIPRGSKNYSFIPTQNLVCQEFSLLEVMQWVPQPTHQRKTGAGVFMLPNHTIVTQSQVYQNYKFDANGNQTSLTYGDNILQKTTWHVQN